MTTLTMSLSGASRRKSGYLHHLPSLFASLAPGAAFAAGLLFFAGHPAFPELARVGSWPWQLFAMGASGLLATAAGVGDWIFHRRAGVVIGWKERRAELLALTLGGLPMFALLAAATFAADPRPYLVPTLLVLVATTVMICFDELVYHRRRCGRLETALHRVLVFGHAGAFLAWVHLVFVRGGFHV